MDWASQRGWRSSTAAPRPAGHTDRLQARRLGVLPRAGRPRLVLRGRAEVIDHTLWVTPFDEESVARRRVLKQSRGSDGLPGGRRPTGRSPIPTSSCGTSSASTLPRREDWPVMPVDTVAFAQQPWGFFHEPALDVPPNPARCHSRSLPPAASRAGRRRRRRPSRARNAASPTHRLPAQPEAQKVSVDCTPGTARMRAIRRAGRRPRTPPRRGRPSAPAAMTT